MGSRRDDVLDYLTASRDGDEESAATRLRPRLLGMDPGVVLTILRALPSAIASAGVRDPCSEALVESARDMADNARDLAEAFGDRARDRLVEGHYDSSPIVRALATMFLGLRTVSDRASIEHVRVVFSSDPDTTVRLAAATALIASDHASETEWRAGIAALEAWADGMVPRWKAAALAGGLRAQDALQALFLSFQPHWLVVEALRNAASEDPTPVASQSSDVKGPYIDDEHIVFEGSGSSGGLIVTTRAVEILGLGSSSTVIPLDSITAIAVGGAIWKHLSISTPLTSYHWEAGRDAAKAEQARCIILSARDALLVRRR